MGLNGYGDLLLSTLQKTPSPIILIGFSVGASAVWQISESLNLEKVKRAVCFYGSQIRYLTEIQPNIMVDLVLPIHEAGFSVKALARILSDRKHVVLHRTPYLHGFMNERSQNYDKAGYSRYVDWLCQHGD